MNVVPAIKKAMRAAPFEPFNIALDNGSMIRIRHPDCVIVSSQWLMALDHQRVPWTVATGHVSGINFEPPPRRDGRKRK